MDGYARRVRKVMGQRADRAATGGTTGEQHGELIGIASGLAERGLLQRRIID